MGLFHQLRDAVLSTTSIEEAINVVCDHTSLINTNYLLAIAKKFKLQDAIALINQYDNSVDEFCRKIPIAHTYGQEFMLQSSRHLQKSEKVEFVLEWDDDDKTLKDVQGLLRNAFHEHAEYVMVIKISPTKSISVICYAPSHLHKELVKVVKANEEYLRKVKILSVAIGLQEVLKREPELKDTQADDSGGHSVGKILTNLKSEEEQEKLDSDLYKAIEKGNRNIIEVERLIKEGANLNKKHGYS